MLQFYEEDLSPKAVFTLLNLQDGTYKQVGEVTTDTTTITSPLVFLGDTPDPPVITGSKIYFTLNASVENTETFISYNERGIHVAYDELNNDSPLLPNF